MGLLEIGYHILIEKDGRLVFPRPVSAMGSHAPGLNDTSVGVCLIGGANEEGRSVEDFSLPQIRELMATLRNLKTIYPEARVVGHTEVQHLRRHAHACRCPALDMQDLRNRL